MWVWRRLAVDFFFRCQRSTNGIDMREKGGGEESGSLGEIANKKKEKEERNKNARNNERYHCAVGCAVLQVWFFEESVRKSSFVSGT